MRPIRLVTAGLVFLAAAMPPAWAQEWCPLEKKDARERTTFFAGATQWLGKTSAKPARLKGLPEEMGKKPSYFSATINGRKTWLVVGSPPIDTKSRARISPKFVADTNQNGDLSDETVLTGRKKREGGWLFGRTLDSYGPVTFKPAEDANASSVDLSFQYYGSDGLAVSPAFDREGDVTVDGQEFHLVLCDGNVDGRFDGFYVPLKEQAEQDAGDLRWAAFSTSDLISIAVKDAKPAAPDSTIYFWDRPPLTKTMRLKDAYYNVEVKPDGSAIRLTKADLPMGTLDVGCADAYLTLFSECGVQNLQGSEGKWSLPAGKYACWSLGLRQTDDAKVTWWLQGSGEMGKLAEIVIESGKTNTIRMGPPFKVKTASQRGSGFLGRNRYISMTLTGQAGESYSHGAYKDKWRLPAPKLKILDEKDKVLASGQFEYG